jgi:hypothetical protein
VGIATFNLALGNLEVPNIGLNIVAILFGAGAVMVCGVILRQFWTDTHGNSLRSHGAARPQRASAGPQADLSEPLHLLALVAELKSNLTQCRAPTAGPLAMDEFLSFCDALVQLPYEAMEKTWAAYAEIIKINHFAARVSSFAGGMNDGSARVRCIQAKTACRDRLKAAIDALERTPMTTPSHLPEDIEPVLPIPFRTVGAVLGAHPSLANPH